MPLRLLSGYCIALFVFLLPGKVNFGQTCTNLGQTPATAFPVCGTTVFHQASVPLCATVNIYVPGCSSQPGGASYQNKNPYFYKFTCYTGGTLGFLVSPLAVSEDYDWQLWDITGRNPDEIFTNNSLVVTGNWSGTYGNTGAAAGGVTHIQCGSNPADNLPTFSAMPTLIAGHEYILMISHFTSGQSGYDLSFGGGTAVITDPTVPHLGTATPDCDGTKITIKLNKKVKCVSLTGGGTEFSLSPAAAAVMSAVTDSCSSAFDFDELTLTLSAPLPTGNYDLIINNGTDGNTLRDHCDNQVPQAEKISFSYNKPQPIFADSIGKFGCAPASIRVYFPKKINCATIAANGSDFAITGPAPVNISGASATCVGGKTDYITVTFSSPVVVKGNYTLTLKAGSDGDILIDECGQETPTQSLSFSAVDTVSAAFQYRVDYGCVKDTVYFVHDGLHDVSTWQWTINTLPPVLSQTSSAVFSASSVNNVQLIVSNGVCADTTSETITLDNEVKASFDMDEFTCPEDKVAVTNTSTGSVNTWQWRYGAAGNSFFKDPPPFQFPILNREINYIVTLVATNLSLGCSDSATKMIKVLDHCYIDVPSAFTPNNDGLNDNFGPHNALKADNYDFRIFNRWGQLVFESQDWKKRWDGKLKGVLQGTGTYVWMLRYTNRDTQKEVFKKGTVTLIR